MPLQTDREKCAHLLRRFGLGASEAELDYYLKDGFAKAHEKLLDYEDVDEGFPVEITDLRNQNQNLNMPSVIAWWAARMVVTRRPLQEKMTLFWHDHFATSASKVNQPLMMYAQNEVLRKNAVGKFREMLGEVSKDPAMLFWLDNQENVAGKPNENFAREVMELFTVGIGNYTEKDVQESARAFTGWSFRRYPRAQAMERKTQAQFVERPRLHDDGPKTILGQTASFNGDEVLDMLCEKPRTAEYLTQKIWEWFVYPNPEPGVIARHAEVFRGSGLDIKALLRSVMTSPEFYSDKAERAVVKNPVDFCISTLRQLGVGEAVRTALSRRTPEGTLVRGGIAPAQQAVISMKAMGMWLMYPPDVAGWDGGNAWISSATMVERLKWADKILAGRFPAMALFREDPTPEGMVKRLISVLDAPIPEAKIPALVDAAKKATGDTLTQRNANAAATQVARLIFAAPEFQFV